MILILHVQNIIAMKHLKNSLLLTMGLLAAPSFFAQSKATSITDPTPYNKVERVCEDFSTPAPRKMKSALTRSVELGDDQLYYVRTVSAEGVLRMEGTYLDSTLTLAHGTFNYYHANGRPESSGSFVNGVKAGTWACWSVTGEERASRQYAGLQWDELQFVVGVADRAQVIGNVNEQDADQPSAGL